MRVQGTEFGVEGFWLGLIPDDELDDVLPLVQPWDYNTSIITD